MIKKTDPEAGTRCSSSGSVFVYGLSVNFLNDYWLVTVRLPEVSGFGLQATFFCDSYSRIKKFIHGQT